jgi:hypothetical protein
METINECRILIVDTAFAMRRRDPPTATSSKRYYPLALSPGNVGTLLAIAKRRLPE